MIKADDYYDYDLRITSTKAVDIQKGMYGLFFEDINYAADGGLNENNTHYLEFIASDTQKGFKNQAYDGVYMESGKKYNVSLYAKKAHTKEALRRRYILMTSLRRKQFCANIFPTAGQNMRQ